MLMVRVLLWVCFLVVRPAWAEVNPSVVDIYTNYGAISVQLKPEKAPLTVANFLSYVHEGFYTNTVFHRVMAGFMIQGGGFTLALQRKITHAPIKLESATGLLNVRGAVAMARTEDADSATAQFFINSVDNPDLNYKDASNPGYAVFGQVIAGMDVVDAISAVQTSKAAATKDVPLQPVLISGVNVREAQLRFSVSKGSYAPGETLSVILQEEVINRNRGLDLWVAVRLPSGEFQFISPENTTLLSSQAKPFKRNVSISSTQHPVLSFQVPNGLTGTYGLYALYIEPGADITTLSQTQRSNLANTVINLH